MAKPKAPKSAASSRTSKPAPAPQRIEIKNLPDPVRVRGGQRAAPARPPPVKVATRPQTRSTIKTLSQNYTREAVARASGVSASTLRRWEKQGIPAAAKDRAATAATNANKRLYVSRSEARRLANDLKDAQRLGHGAAAAAGGRSASTINRYVKELEKKRPDPRIASRARQAILEMDKNTKKSGSKKIQTKDKAGKVTSRKGIKTEYEGVRPPRKASAYRIAGYDKKGKSVWSTLQSADYDSLLKEAEQKRKHYRTADIRIELIDLYDDYFGSDAERADIERDLLAEDLSEMGWSDDDIDEFFEGLE